MFKRVIVATVTMFFQQWTGINGMPSDISFEPFNFSYILLKEEVFSFKKVSFSLFLLAKRILNSDFVLCTNDFQISGPLLKYHVPARYWCCWCSHVHRNHSIRSLHR